MAIKSINEKQSKLEIDLTGSDGNAFVLIGMVKGLASQTNKDADKITKEMQSGDYENLLQVFDREFGDYVTLYR